MLPAEAQFAKRPAGPAARSLTIAAAAALSLCLGSCGDDEGASTAGGVPATSLTITVDPDGPGGAEARSETFECPGGATAVCAAVESLPADPAAPVPPQTACTEIYGGPDTLTVEGTLAGDLVDARLTRTNGCEIERFDRFTELLTALFPDYRPGSAIGA